MDNGLSIVCRTLLIAVLCAFCGFLVVAGAILISDSLTFGEARSTVATTTTTTTITFPDTTPPLILIGGITIDTAGAARFAAQQQQHRKHHDAFKQNKNE